MERTSKRKDIYLHLASYWAWRGKAEDPPDQQGQQQAHARTENWGERSREEMEEGETSPLSQSELQSRSQLKYKNRSKYIAIFLTKCSDVWTRLRSIRYSPWYGIPRLRIFTQLLFIYCYFVVNEQITDTMQNHFVHLSNIHDLFTISLIHCTGTNMESSTIYHHNKYFVGLNSFRNIILHQASSFSNNSQQVSFAG